MLAGDELAEKHTLMPAEPRATLNLSPGAHLSVTLRRARRA
jgi:hypothetical protein